MLVADLIEFITRVQALIGILPNRFEHSKARLAIGALRL